MLTHYKNILLPVSFNAMRNKKILSKIPVSNISFLTFQCSSKIITIYCKISPDLNHGYPLKSPKSSTFILPIRLHPWMIPIWEHHPPRMGIESTDGFGWLRDFQNTPNSPQICFPNAHDLECQTREQIGPKSGHTSLYVRRSSPWRDSQGVVPVYGTFSPF